MRLVFGSGYGRESSVDVLAAFVLVAVDGDGVFASGFEGFSCLFADGEVLVLAGPAFAFEEFDAVDVDDDVVVVVEPEVEVIGDFVGEVEGAAEPDVLGVPRGGDDGSGGVFDTESGFAGFPGLVVEVRLEPIG